VHGESHEEDQEAGCVAKAEDTDEGVPSPQENVVSDNDAIVDIEDEGQGNQEYGE
jgi:hypothetical protein